MITPLPRKLTNINEILSESNDTQLIETIKESFSRNIGYTKVNKNFNYTTFYDVVISDGDKDKEEAFKKILSYPYSEIQFQRGDYIHFKYGGIDSTWLLTTLDVQLIHDVNGRIYECNEMLRWVDNDGITQEYPCVIQDKQTQGLFKFEQYIKTLTGTIYIDAQWNADTMKIKEDDRFLFKGQAFRVSFINPYLLNNCVTFTMEKDTKANNDDLINNIANETVIASTPTDGSFW